MLFLEKRYLVICENDFGINLKKLREKQNYSQEQLAKKLKISRQSISKWEQGISLPCLNFIIPLCKALKCDLEELLQGLNRDLKH